MSGENRPPTLVPKTVKEMNIRISASRKLGVARPRKPRSVSPWSAQVYWWVAEYRPIGKAMSHVNTIEPNETTNVSSNRSPMMSATGRSYSNE
jgi:hypothetical protein